MADALPFDPTRPAEYEKHGPRKALSFQAPIGSVFTHWTVIEHLPSRHGHRYLRCQCVCGKIKDVMGGHVVRGKSTNCGCQHPRDGNRKHGLSDTRTHNIWIGMLDRCQRKANKAFKHYGGRGIQVCERWREFANFLADMGEAPEGLSLERSDNNGNYEPGNCIWATQSQQCNNRRDNVRLTLQGRTQTLAEWAAELGLTQGLIRHRYDRGWGHERILTTPRMKNAHG